MVSSGCVPHDGRGRCVPLQVPGGKLSMPSSVLSRLGNMHTAGLCVVCPWCGLLCCGVTASPLAVMACEPLWPVTPALSSCGISVRRRSPSWLATGSIPFGHGGVTTSSCGFFVPLCMGGWASGPSRRGSPIVGLWPYVGLRGVAVTPSRPWSARARAGGAWGRGSGSWSGAWIRAGGVVVGASSITQ